MTTRDQHDALPGEASLTDLYQQDKELEPRREIDAAILSAAQSAVASGTPGRTGRSWFVPVSVAAVLVLSVSVVMLMQSPPKQEIPPADREEQPRLAMAPPPESTLPESKTVAPKRELSTPDRKRDVADEKRAQATLESDTLAQSPAEKASEFRAEPAETIREDSVAGMVAMQKAKQTPEPDAWLKTIRTLAEQKQHDAARKELLRFRESYPEFRNNELVELAELLDVEIPTLDEAP
jgi:hypothetical protein